MRRSSMTLSGTCTKGAGMTSVSRSARGGPPLSRSVLVKSSSPNSPAGSMLKGLSFRISMGGSSWCSARAMTDLAVPLPPEITTPPMRLLIADSSRACLIGSWPTTIDSGKGRPPDIIWSACLPTITADFSAASSASIAARARSSAVDDTRCCDRIDGPGSDVGRDGEKAETDAVAAHSSAAVIRLGLAILLYFVICSVRLSAGWFTRREVEVGVPLLQARVRHRRYSVCPDPTDRGLCSGRLKRR
mmetsp:Transcript_17318/g.40274  ORF Transcript_17318/g.40274 Transcript_17318/m.40274 type:complete len:246 (+) Transcript_17318:777-1514(+)